MKQKEVFKNGEGDAWFDRNQVSVNYTLVDKVLKLKPETVLEIGCGNGINLAEYKNNGIICSGLEPSRKARDYAKQTYDLSIIPGTADTLLPFKYDMIIFGFCLYLCDREDLFKIAYNCDKMLKNNGYVVIHDFKTKNMYSNPYKHKQGINSYKMDYSNMFTWNPQYTLISTELFDYDTEDTATAIDILQKRVI